MIEGITNPKIGFGLGQYCRPGKKPNARIISNKSKGKNKKKQLALWIEATKDITIDEEIIIPQNHDLSQINHHNEINYNNNQNHQLRGENNNQNISDLYNEEVYHDLADTDTEPHHSGHENDDKNPTDNNISETHDIRQSNPNDHQTNQLNNNEEKQGETTTTNLTLVINNILTTSNHTLERKWTDNSIKHISTSHLHTTHSLNDSFITWDNIGTWHTNNLLEASLGGVKGSMLSYLKNRYTWADLTHTNTKTTVETMKTAITASKSSESEMRVAIISNTLTANEEEYITNYANTNNTRIQPNTIKFPPGSIALQEITKDLRRQKSNLNTSPITITIIENNTAKYYNHENWCTEIINHVNDYNKSKIVTTIKPEWHYHNSLPNPMINLTHTKHPHKKHKSLLWTRDDFPRTTIGKKDDTKPKMKNLELFNPLLGSIGILPQGIKNDLINMGYDHNMINDHNMEKIQQTLAISHG